MLSFVRIGRLSLLTLLLAACGTSAATNYPAASTPSSASPLSATAAVVSTPISKLIEPGDAVGDATLITIPDPTQVTRAMTENCGGDTVRKPGVYDFKCATSLGSMRFLGIGWSNIGAKALESDWSHMKWTAYLDGQEIDLKSFGTYDGTIGDYVIRSWNVAIKDTTPREYTLRVIYELQQPATEGDTVYPPGAYDVTNHITVVKPIK